jgi:hypothetical protein
MPTSQYKIHGILVLSTNHITEEDADLVAGVVPPGKGATRCRCLSTADHQATRHSLSMPHVLPAIVTHLCRQFNSPAV